MLPIRGGAGIVRTQERRFLRRPDARHQLSEADVGETASLLPGGRMFTPPQFVYAPSPVCFLASTTNEKARVSLGHA